jgi:hypothetical protein
MSAVRCHVILIRRAHVGDPGGAVVATTVAKDVVYSW